MSASIEMCLKMSVKEGGLIQEEGCLGAGLRAYRKRLWGDGGGIYQQEQEGGNVGHCSRTKPLSLSGGGRSLGLNQMTTPAQTKTCTL